MSLFLFYGSLDTSSTCTSEFPTSRQIRLSFQRSVTSRSDPSTMTFLSNKILATCRLTFLATKVPRLVLQGWRGYLEVTARKYFRCCATKTTKDVKSGNHVVTPSRRLVLLAESSSFPPATTTWFPTGNSVRSLLVGIFRYSTRNN